MAYAHKLTGAHPIKLRDIDPEEGAGLKKEEPKPPPPDVVVKAPPPKGFQVLTAPIKIPLGPLLPR